MITLVLAWQMSLGQLQDESLRTHPLLEQATAALESARQQLTEAERAWWPNFSVEGSVIPAWDVQCTDFPICTQANIRDFARTAPDEVATRWELRMVFPVYTFGKLSTASDLAGIGAHAAEARLEATVADLRNWVARAYWDARLSRALLVMYDEARTHNDEALARAAEKDKNRLIVRLADIDTRREDAIKFERTALASLRNLVPSHPSLTVEDVPLAPLEVADRPAAFYIEAARVHRPESQLLDWGVKAARENVRLQHEFLFPDIVLAGSIFKYYSTAPFVDPSGPYMLHPFGGYGFGGGLITHWDADLHLKIPRWLRASEEYESALAGSRAAIDGIGLEVLLAWETLQETRQRMNIMVSGNRDATRWLALAQQRFVAKKADAREFTDALVGYLDARRDYLWSIHDYNIAVAWLSRVTGVEVSNLQHPADH